MSKPRTPAPDDAPDADRPTITVTRGVKILKRIEEVDLSEDGYPGWTIHLWLNPRDSWVQQWIREEVTVGDVCKALIVDWNLVDEDDQPAPVTPEMVDSLPSDVLQILNREFWQRRLAPLVTRAERDGSASSKDTPSDSPNPT
jgi:hypothetical protein